MPSSLTSVRSVQHMNIVLILNNIQILQYQINHYILRSSQRPSIYPSRQPLEHSPLTWSHGSLFIQCPLQCLLQFIPKYSGGHSMKRRKNSVRHKCNNCRENQLVSICIPWQVIGQLAQSQKLELDSMCNKIS